MNAARPLKISAVAAVFIAAVLFSGTAPAGTVSGLLEVRAYVLPSIDYEVRNTRRDITVTPADIRKGRKRVPNGTMISVRSNSPGGYLLTVCLGDINGITSADIFLNGTAHRVAPNGCVEIQGPYSGRSTAPELKRLSYRFHLSPDAERGRRPWPVFITVDLI